MTREERIRAAIAGRKQIVCPWRRGCICPNMTRILFLWRKRSGTDGKI
ncbi:MAG: hypothetical protein ACLUIQ_01895 [Dialister invisus]